MIGHTGPISGVATSNERYIATAGYDNLVLLWLPEEKAAVSRGSHDHLVNNVQFSRNGNFLVSASSDYSARIWSVPDLRLISVLGGHQDDVEMAAFSPDDSLVATVSRDYSVKIFDFSGRCLSTLTGHERDVLSVAWSNTGKRLITSGDDGTVREWDASTGELLRTYDLAGVETDTIAVSSDGSLLAGDDTGRISIISGTARNSVQAHDSGVKRLVLDEGSSQILSLSYDRTAKLWSLHGGRLATLVEGRMPDIVWPRSAAFFSPSEVIFGTFGSSYAKWNLRDNVWDVSKIGPDKSLNAVSTFDGRVVAIGDRGTLYDENQPVSELGSLCNFLVPFSSRLITGGQSGIIYDAYSGESLYQHRSPLNCATIFRRGGRAVCAVGSYTGEVLILEAGNNGVSVVDCVRLHENAIKGLAANDDVLFSVCATGAVALHRLIDFSRESFFERGHEKIANACTVVKGGFASVGRDRRLRIWKDNAVQIVESPHQNSVKCICSDPSGSSVITGSYTGWIAEYSLDRDQWASYKRISTSGISSLSYDRSRDNFLATSYDGVIHRIRPITRGCRSTA